MPLIHIEVQACEIRMHRLQTREKAPNKKLY